MTYVIRRTLLSLLLPLTFVAPGCDDADLIRLGDDAGVLGDAGHASGLELDAFYAAMEAKFCARSLACGVLYATEGDCEAIFARRLRDEIKPSIEVGYSEFVPENAACALALEPDDCTPQDWTDKQQCPPAIRGLQAVGEACGANEHCAYGAYCGHDEGLCPGTCEPLRSLGAAVARCDKASACEGSAAGDGQQTCAPRAGLGESCAQVPCARGSCDFLGGELCVPFAGLAEDCGPGLAVCAHLLKCVDAKCVSWPLAGESCTARLPCRSNAFCNYEAAPEGSGLCEAKRTPQSACTASEQCAGGMVCRPRSSEQVGDRVCAPRGATGDACALLNNECAEGLSCFLDTQQCEAPRGAGATCDDRDDCQSPARCLGGRCVMRAANGQACSRSVECASEFCDQGFCNDFPSCCPFSIPQ